MSFQFHLPAAYIVDSLSPPARDEFLNDLRSVQAEVAAGVVPERSTADKKIWAKWIEFTSSLHLDGFLQTLADPVPILQVFAHRVRDGRLALGGGDVRARTAEAYTRAVGQTFTGLGQTDPRLNVFGKIDFRLQRQLASWKKEDPAAQRMKPFPIGFIHCAFKMLRSFETAYHDAIAWMLYVAFFFLMRPGEYCDNGPSSHPFLMRDVQLHVGSQKLVLAHESDAMIRAADFCGLTFTTQKSGVKGEVVGHSRSGALGACPVRALAEMTLSLRNIGAPDNTPLASYREMPGAPIRQLTGKDFSEALKAAARVHGGKFGVDPDDVTVGCFRTSGAMALMCGGVDSCRTRLLGRWQSWTMLRYLHMQARSATRGMSSAMLRGGALQSSATSALPDFSPEPPDSEAMVVPAPTEGYEQPLPG